MTNPGIYHAPTQAEADRNAVRRSELAIALAHTTRVVGRIYDPNTLYDMVSVPDTDDPTRTRLKSLERGGFARTIKNHEKRDISTLPDFIVALSKIGEFKEPPLREVVALRHDRSGVSGIEREEAIIYGIHSPFFEHSLPVETMDYVATRLRINTTDGVSKLTGRRGELDDRKGRIMDAWTRHTSEYDFDGEPAKSSGVFATIRAYTDERDALLHAHRRNRGPVDLEGGLDALAQGYLPQAKTELVELGSALMEAAAPTTVAPHTL